MSDSIKSKSEQRTRVTDEFREAHERVFGIPTRKPGRTRYVYTSEGCIEVGEDWEPTQAETVPVVTDRHYEGIKATDGTDISSRAKRKEYMRRHGLADADDFKQHWEKKAQERAQIQRGDHPAQWRELRETVGRALHEHRNKRGKK